MSRRSKQRGVTLVETLVALAVMGLIIGALLVLVGQNSRFAAAMRDKTMAQIAADNLMVEAMVLTSALEAGETEGEVNVGGAVMRYTRTVADAGVGDVLRIDIQVAAENGQTLARAVSMRRPQ